MNLLHLVASISPESGGPTEVIRMMIRHAPPGDSAEVVTLDDPTAPFLRDLPFTVHALGSPKQRWYSPKLIPWLHTNRHRFDAALIHGLWQYTGLAAHRTLHGHIPYAVFPHGMLDPWFKRTFPTKHLKKWIFWQLFERRLLADATRVLFTTQRERDLAQQTFWPSKWNAAVISIGTDDDWFSIPLGSASPPRTPPTANITDALAAFHRCCPQLKDQPFILFLGRLNPKKGCWMLVNAFTRITELDHHLVIAGPEDGERSLKLRHLSEAAGFADRIHFPGMLTGPAKWGALAACEAFILPSHQENFGIAVVEALALGKPVLISDQVNIAPDILADNCGLVEPDTLDGTRRLLERWLALTPEDRATLSTNARTTFATRYDMRLNTAAILDTLRQGGSLVKGTTSGVP